MLVALLIASCGAVRASAKALEPPTLSTVRAVRQLPIDKASLNLRVDIRGVVTFLDRAKSTMFVQDKTGGIFVSIDPMGREPIAAGYSIRVTGVSGPGEFAPVVLHPTVTVLSKAHFPLGAPKVSLLELMTGTHDSQWVEIEGTVHSVEVFRNDVTLRIALRDGMVTALSLREPGIDYNALVDARIALRTVSATVFNMNRQLIGARLFFPSVSTLRVIERGPTFPFEAPLVPIDTLARFSSQVSSLHRVHLRGRATLVWPNTMVCLEDASGGLCAEAAETASIPLGTTVDLVGFPAHGESAPVLTDAVVRQAPEGVVLPATPPERSLSIESDAKLVMIEGELVSRDLAMADTTLLLNSGGALYSVILPKSLTSGDVAQWKTGSIVRVQGICSVQVDTLHSAQTAGMALPKSYRILLRSTADVTVLRQSTWWTPGHTSLVVGLIFVVMILTGGWATMLRRTVEQQTRTIRESENRFRYLAQHDALTGLATRTLLHDRLEEGLARCRREGTGLALLMVDLDHFKAINDTYGHAAGDMTLRITAERLLGSVRADDTVARMGGDEFIVLLTDVRDLRTVEGVAEQLIATLSRPLPFADQDLPVSASVGVCTALNDQFDAEGLLKNVDAAMYRAKAAGRGRFQLAPVILEATA